MLAVTAARAPQNSVPRTCYFNSASSKPDFWRRNGNAAAAEASVQLQGEDRQVPKMYNLFIGAVKAFYGKKATLRIFPTRRAGEQDHGQGSWRGIL